MKFNNVEITQETIIATRWWFIDNNKACIAEARSGAVFVNDLESYIAWRNEQIQETQEGKIDCTFTFIQRAHYMQTGESIGLLP